MVFLLLNHLIIHYLLKKIFLMNLLHQLIQNFLNSFIFDILILKLTFLKKDYDDLIHHVLMDIFLSIDVKHILDKIFYFIYFIFL